MASSIVSSSTSAITPTLPTNTYASTSRFTMATSSPVPTQSALPAVPLRIRHNTFYEYKYQKDPLGDLLVFETIAFSFLQDVRAVTSGEVWASHRLRQQQAAQLGQDNYTGRYVTLNFQHCSVTNKDQHSSQSIDCERACMMPDTLMKPKTVELCLHLATMSMWVRNGSYVLDNERETQYTLEMAGIRNLTAFNGERVVALTTACLADSCRDTRLGTCTETLRKIGDVAVTPESLEGISRGMTDYCDNVPSPANADIAGPGVIISYLIQTVLAIGGGFILKLLTSWLRWSFFPFAALTKLWSSKSRPQAPVQGPADRGCIPSTRRTWSKAKYLQTRVARTRPNAALISSLVEFQEVQAYFLFAIQLATIITFRNDTEGLSLNGIKNFPMVQFSASVVSFLSVDGLLPVLFVQICLQRAGMRWWYTLAITCLVYVFAEIVEARRSDMVPDFDLLWEHFRSQNSVNACGWNPSPMTYCRGPDTWYGNGLTTYTSRFVIVALVVDMLLWFVKSKWPRLERRMRRWDRKSAWFRRTRNRIIPPIWSLYCGTLQVWLMFCLVMSMSSLSRISTIVGMSPDTWSFGQLVAVMVWAPIVGKYLYFNVFGIEEGFGRRLAKHYRIVHDPESSADEDDDISLDDFHVGAQNGVDIKPGFNTSCESQSSFTEEGVLPLPPSTAQQASPQPPPPTTPMRSAPPVHGPPSPRQATAAPPPPSQQMQAVMVGGVMIEVEDVPPSAHGHPTS